MKKNITESLKKVNEVIRKGSFKDNWISLEDYQIPKWYKDAKFGIFIHWGVYSVPGFDNEWYPKWMYVKNSPQYKNHIEKWGDPAKFGYKDFIPLFKAEKFDPDYWADLFYRSGAKYVIPVAEHHDGFAMYDCGFSKWNAVNMGPGRDIIGELSKSVRKKGMIFGLSSHREAHWWYYNASDWPHYSEEKIDSDVRGPRFRDFYGPAAPDGIQPDKKFLDEWLVRTCEIVDKYEPSIVYFDWWIEASAFNPYLRKFAAYYYNRAKKWNGCAINYKNKSFADSTAILDLERGQMSGIRPILWQTCTSIMNDSWGYTQKHEKYNSDFKSAGSIISDLVDIISKNGVLLLNIGPRPDGTIPEIAQQVLLDIGKWLKIFGEAVYGTRPWKTFGEGPTAIQEGAFTDSKRPAYTGEDIRFTCRDNNLYVFIMNWPENNVLRIKSLGQGSKVKPYFSSYKDELFKIRSINQIGTKNKLSWVHNNEYLEIQLPANKVSDNVNVLKIIGGNI